MIRVFKSVTILTIASSIIFARNINSLHTYNYLPDQIVIKTANDEIDIYSIDALVGKINLQKDLDNAVKKVFDGNRVKFKEKVKALGLFRVYTVQIEEGTDILQLFNELNRSENVQCAEPVYIIPQDTIPNDPMYGLQTQIPQMHMPDCLECSA